MLPIIETFGDLAAALNRIGLPLTVRCTRSEWIATIGWSWPDYTTGSAEGHGSTMLQAITACIADYDKQLGARS